MRNIFKSFFAIAVVSILLTNLSFSQSESREPGKLFSKAEADELFGPVLTSIKIDSEDLLAKTKLSPNVIMFKIKEDKLGIFDKNRKSIYSEGFEVNADEVLHLFRTSIVIELVKKGGQAITTVETREKVLSLTNGKVTLEVSFPCPPACYYDYEVVNAK